MKKGVIISFLFFVCCYIYSQGDEKIKFAQLTDIHINRNDDKPSVALLKCISKINAMDNLDFVLITGDLTEEGDDESLMKVKSFLDLLKWPYHVVLGNHETKWSESGCAKFKKIFGDEKFAFEAGNILFLCFNTGPLMRVALGHVAPQDISWMVDTIEKYPKNKQIILVSHYPLLKGDVDNWYEALEALKPYNIRLMIGGHYHRYKALTYGGLPGILSRSSLPDKDGNTGFSIYEITNDSINVYKYYWCDKIALV